ncbi:MAG TPA: sigma-70 family RNA polymerase sigma factor [Pyrinomonadaceae bacterium]|nr:sigma-70 family RNA polymerase sigma factor [Pyrinomonadaceae bacterium]
MTTPPPQDVTQLLLDWSKGNQGAPDKLMPLVYDELRRVAQNYLRHERQDHTLQATALVHEAYLKLIDQTAVDWHDRAHFFGLASQMMRHILVDHARRHQAAKRGGLVQRLTLVEAVSFPDQKDFDLVALDEALTNLSQLDSQQSRIVEMRFFGGLTIEETSTALSLSVATVNREWRLAKAWLLRALTKEESDK